MRVLSIVGPSGSGKTTLIARLIPELKRRGLRVVAVKHSHHRATIEEGSSKDSAELARAGADAVVFVAPDRFTLCETRADEPTLAEVMTRLPPADLVLIEGWKSQRLPCVELIGPGGERVDATAIGARVLLVAAAASAGAVAPGARSRDDVGAIAGLLAAWARS